MIALNQIALFPENKEGLEYYTKWYPLVLTSSAPAQILSFAEVFNKYKYMFINGEDKYFRLLGRAADLGDRSALFILLKEFNYNYQYAVPNRIIPNATDDELLRLLRFFKEKRLKQKVQDIEKILISRNVSLDYKTLYEELQYLYKEKDDSNFNLKLETALLIDDQTQLLKIAKFLAYRGKYNKAASVYERLIALDNNNPSYYQKLEESYRRSSVYNNNSNAEKRIQALKAASLLDDYETTIDLLKIYAKGQKLKDGKLLPGTNRRNTTEFSGIDLTEQYYQHVKQISQMNEAKRGLAKFYYNNRDVIRGAKILNELAENGNENAMVMLAKRVNVRERNPGDNVLAKKWLSFIINSNNWGLIDKLKTATRFLSLEDTADNPEFNKAHARLIQLYETDNIPYLKKRVKESYSRNDEAQQRADLKTAAELGDVQSWHKLAEFYMNDDDAESVNKAISIYKMLAEKDDVTSLAKLGSIYKSPRPFMQEIQSDQTAINYYTRAADLDHVNSMYELFCLYFCRKSISPEKMKEYQNKIDVYIDKMIAMKTPYTLLIRDVASMYYNLKDFEKSAYYYQKGGDAGNQNYYKKAALIYKNQLNDNDKYLYYLHKASEAGNGDASFDLSQYYKQKQDDKNTLKYLLIASEDENKNAMEALADNYVSGTLVEKDIHKAVALYKKAAWRNPMSIGLKLGLIYHHGKDGIEVDLKQAKKWYLKSFSNQAKENLKIVNKQIKANKLKL